MYSRFFGFKERPFKLLPDPTYLFLSKSHEEALAHLKYAVEHGEGFVEITGEVGTGKTTLCRVFLERLLEDTEVAYIFNPKLDSVQLLKAINDEFGIDSSAGNTKDLIDTLNIFLMQQKAAGKKVILIIDEAQNLSIEVLEQLRLLSNLETTRSKLLQIILVGQPELADMLDSHELRQLGQRISLSCHLSPLTHKETTAYIEHRLQVARPKQDRLFSRDAAKAVFQYAGGIPRLINIVCDRSLLVAYSRNRQKVSGKIVRLAIQELASRGDLRKRLSAKFRPLAFAAVCGAAVVGMFWLPGIIHREPGLISLEKPFDDFSAVADTAPKTVPEPETTAAAAPISAAPQRPEAHEPVALEDFIEQADSSATRYNAMKELLALWQVESHGQPFLESIEDDLTYFNLVARQHGLNVCAVHGNPDLVKRLNLPAIFKFEGSGSRPASYLALKHIQDSQASFGVMDSKGSATISLDALAEKFKGTAFVVWKNYMGFEGTIPLSYPKGSVIMLKMLLREIGHREIEIDAVYGAQTQETVKAIQRKYGLTADGYVGPLTKIVLYNEKGGLPAPRLVSHEPPPKGNES